MPAHVGAYLSRNRLLLRADSSGDDMEQKLVIDSSLQDIRIALLEEGNLIEVFTERALSGDVGSFYRGRVTRVLPALQSAFIDIGLDRDGFLGWDDYHLLPEQRKKKIRRMEDALKYDNLVLVQIAKEARGHKGCRLTTRFSIPGRYLVLLHGTQRVMVSKKITGDKEAKRLKQIVSSFSRPGIGFIIRTVSEGVSKTELSQDAKYLIRIYEKALSEFTKGKRPQVLMEELGIVPRVLRDKWTKNCKEIIVDSQEIRHQVLDTLSLMAPRTPLRKLVKDFEGKGSVFTDLGLDEQLKFALDRKVWLKSGGYLIVEEAESLTVIDVNSGRHTEGQNLDEIALKVNMESAQEIAHQLRLRNLGGIIVIDFINLSSKREQDKILREFRKHTKPDRAVTNIYGFSDLGVVQVCRERNRESISKMFTVQCPHCQGTGRLPKYDEHPSGKASS